jgi:uncharacterized protein (DUF983 family)
LRSAAGGATIDLVSSQREQIARTWATPPEKGVVVPSEFPGKAFLRGCIKHCPICGQRNLFRRWFQMIERCPRCGLKFDRIEGHWSGYIGVNTIVSFGVLLVVLLGGVLLSWPDPNMLVIGVAAIAVAAFMPIVVMPFSRTIWLAGDLLMRPLEPGEVRPGFGPQPGDPEPRRGP